jgi:hypothetical protein
LRKRRTRQHVVADIGARHVEWIAAKAGFTAHSSPLGADYGIDMSLYTFDSDGYVENEEVKLQVKSSDRLKPVLGGREFAILINNKDLNHWLIEVVPVILILHDVSLERSYWIYVQRYFELKRNHFLLRQPKKSTTIRIPKANILDVRAMRRFAEFKRDVLLQLNGKVSHV